MPQRPGAASTCDSLGGSPWDPASAQLYRTCSPITYASAITTPTLTLSGSAEITVPITESFALYHALASRNILNWVVAHMCLCHPERRQRSDISVIPSEGSVAISLSSRAKAA